MAMEIQKGMEMKLTVKASGINGTKNKTIRYMNPLAPGLEDNLPLAALFGQMLIGFSEDTYIQTNGSIDLGILDGQA